MRMIRENCCAKELDWEEDDEEGQVTIVFVHAQLAGEG